MNTFTQVPFWESIWNARFSLLRGLGNTLLSAGYAILIGTILGILVGLVLTYGHKYVKLPFRLLVDVIRGIPGLVTVFMIYYFLDYGLSRMGISISAFFSGVVALTLPCCAQTAELTRGALQSIPPGQAEAGKALGMRFWQIFGKILFPQAIVRILPPWVNTASEMVKGSTLLSLVGVTELLLATRQLVAVNLQALKYYVFAGVIYFAINTLIEYAGKKAEKKLNYYHVTK